MCYDYIRYRRISLSSIKCFSNNMVTYKPPAFIPCYKLREIREEKGLTQTQLSRMLILAGYNISAGYISRFELGYSKPWANAKKGISEILDIPEDFIF